MLWSKTGSGIRRCVILRVVRYPQEKNSAKCGIASSVHDLAVRCRLDGFVSILLDPLLDASRPFILRVYAEPLGGVNALLILLQAARTTWLYEHTGVDFTASPALHVHVFAVHCRCDLPMLYYYCCCCTLLSNINTAVVLLKYCCTRLQYSRQPLHYCY